MDFTSLTGLAEKGAWGLVFLIAGVLLQRFFPRWRDRAAKETTDAARLWERITTLETALSTQDRDTDRRIAESEERGRVRIAQLETEHATCRREQLESQKLITGQMVQIATLEAKVVVLETQLGQFTKAADFGTRASRAVEIADRLEKRRR